MVNLIRIKQNDPDSAVRNRQGELEYLTFPKLSELDFTEHLFTTRLGGVSKGHLGTMNLSFSRGDEPECVLENYRRISQVLHSDSAHIVASMQTHTTNIRVVERGDMGKGVVKPQDYTDVDGLITDTPGIVLACFYADCVPLYFADPIRRVIGVAHSGWRGTVEKMGACMTEKMREVFGTDPKDLVAVIGPSVCRDCYEVGEDVAQRFRQLFPETVSDGKRPGKFQVDLWLANRLILQEAGVPEANISVTDLCTCHNPEYLFSHRASHGRRGNLAAMIKIREGT